MRSKEASVTVFTGVTEAIAPPTTAASTFDPDDVEREHAGSDMVGGGGGDRFTAGRQS